MKNSTKVLLIFANVTFLFCMFIGIANAFPVILEMKGLVLSISLIAWLILILKKNK